MGKKKHMKSKFRQGKKKEEGGREEITAEE